MLVRVSHRPAGEHAQLAASVARRAPGRLRHDLRRPGCVVGARDRCRRGTAHPSHVRARNAVLVADSRTARVLRRGQAEEDHGRGWRGTRRRPRSSPTRRIRRAATGITPTCCSLRRAPGVFRVNPDGSGLAAVTTLDAARGEYSHGWPEFLPDGRRFLFVVRSSQPEHSGLYLTSLDKPDERKRVMPDYSRAAYSSGYLLFARDGSLVAAAVRRALGRVAGQSDGGGRPRQVSRRRRRRLRHGRECAHPPAVRRSPHDAAPAPRSGRESGAPGVTDWHLPSSAILARRQAHRHGEPRPAEREFRSRALRPRTVDVRVGHEVRRP